MLGIHFWDTQASKDFREKRSLVGFFNPLIQIHSGREFILPYVTVLNSPLVVVIIFQVIGENNMREERETEMTVFESFGVIESPLSSTTPMKS